MKRLFSFILSLIITVLTISVGFVNAFSISTEAKYASDISKKLISISINTYPEKTSYIQGEKLDMTGFSIKLTYSDKTTEIINEGYTYFPETFDDWGPQTISVTYKDKTVSFEVYVAQSILEISKIKVESIPTKTVYYVGDTFDTSGMSIRINYSDGSSEVMDYGYSCTPKTFSTEGKQKVTVTYAGKSDSFDVNVLPLTVDSILVNTKDSNPVSFTGISVYEIIDSICVNLNNGTQQHITSGFVCTPETFTEAGLQSVTVSYSDASAVFDVYVYSQSVESVEIFSPPYNLEYFVGEALDVSGLALSVNYNDGTQEIVYSGFECNPEVFTESGTQFVNIRYNDFTLQFTVEIYDVAPAMMQIKNLPNKTEYSVGDTIDTEGLTLSVVYNNGMTAEVTDGYTLNMYNFEYEGSYIITVFYGELYDTFMINVSKKSIPSGKTGDVDGDGLITLKDVTLLSRWFAGGWDVTICEENSDVNKDGMINVKDVVILKRYLAGGWNITLDEEPNTITCSQFIYGKSEMGKDLICYSIAPENYDRTILLNFAIHGFEDDYDHDGQVLKDLALMLVDHYSQVEDLNNTRILIIPNANPDGLEDGYSNNTFGRCNSNGVDLNRDFDANYVSNNSARNYTPYAFSASESRALRDLCLEYNPEIVIDFHGWLNTTIGDQELAQIFRDEMGLAHQVGFTSTNCRGYFANWAHKNGALALLVEFTNPNVSQSALIRAVDRMVYSEYDNNEGQYRENTTYSEFTPLDCYTISSGRTTTYRDIGVPFDTVSYIEGTTDLCTILKIYENGWVKVSYPTSSGDKTAYCHLTDFIPEECSIQPYSGNVSENTNVYRRQDLSETIGSVWTTDNFSVVSQTDSAYQIIYPLDNGGFKMGWIQKSKLK